jgi:transposase
MRGQDDQQLGVFSYVSPEQRVPQDHPLRSLRAMTDEALRNLQPRFNKLYAKTGRPSIAPRRRYEQLQNRLQATPRGVEKRIFGGRHGI